MIDDRAPATPMAPMTDCYSLVGQPAPRGSVTADDYLLTYGPLGIMSAIFLAIIAVLWRDRGTIRKELAAEALRREGDCTRERDTDRAALVALARESNDTTRAVNDSWHNHARELRGALESTTRKIGRRDG